VATTKTDRGTQRDRKQSPLIFNNTCNIKLEVWASKRRLSWGMEKPGSNLLNPNPGGAIKGMASYNIPKEEEIQACHQLKKS
jgi:hypothetical protein